MTEDEKAASRLTHGVPGPRPTPAHRAVTRERSFSVALVARNRLALFQPPGAARPTLKHFSLVHCQLRHRLVGWWPAHYRQAARSLVPGRSLCSPVLLSPQPADWPLQQAFGLHQAAAVSRQRPPRCSELGRRPGCSCDLALLIWCSTTRGQKRGDKVREWSSKNRFGKSCSGMDVDLDQDLIPTETPRRHLHCPRVSEPTPVRPIV